MANPIFQAIENGKNIMLHGIGGTGKTTALKEIIKYLKFHEKIFAVTATTGMAAINIHVPGLQKASTFHSWAGFGLAKEDGKALINTVYRYKSVNKWKNTNILIIDEVSMFGAKLFDKADYVGKILRYSDQPFGGIQLIVTGDFLQLPPVNDNWVFKSEVWDTCNFQIFEFYQPKRYKDINFFEMLCRIRIGELTQNDISTLKSRLKEYKKTDFNQEMIKPTILYSKRVDVDMYNSTELMKLPSKLYTFHAHDTFKSKTMRYKLEDYDTVLEDLITTKLPLKVGAQLMLTRNIDTSSGYVNGSRCVCTDIRIHEDFLKTEIDLQFFDGSALTMLPLDFDYEDEDAIITRYQLPLRLAWASTIHRTQGCSIDYAIVDIGSSIFLPGQAYVALSRMRNIEGLFISEFYERSIQADEEAIKYVKTMNVKKVDFEIKFGKKTLQVEYTLI